MGAALKHISLFSGMGGFDLAAQWMGWENIAHVEQNSFCLQILKHYWPNAETHTDIRTTDFTVYRGKCDILTGGFPCQPFSTAGNRKGTEDDRYLWPEMCRAINEARPRYVVGENVTGICSMVFPPRGVKVESETTIEGEDIYRTLETNAVRLRIIEDLERIDYTVQPVIIPAAAVNAPHSRQRVWLLATNTQSGRHRGVRNKGKKAGPQRGNDTLGSKSGIPIEERTATNANQQRLERRQRGRTGKRNEQANRIKAFSKPEYWEKFPTQPPVCAGNDGLPTQLHGIAVSKWRKESLKAAGNAIVPQVAYEIFKAVEELEKTNPITTPRN